MNVTRPQVIAASALSLVAALFFLWVAAKMYAKHPAAALLLAAPALIFLVKFGVPNLQNIGILPKPPATVTRVS